MMDKYIENVDSSVQIGIKAGYEISFFDTIEFLKQKTLIFYLFSPSLYNTTTEDRESMKINI